MLRDLDEHDLMYELFYGFCVAGGGSQASGPRWAAVMARAREIGREAGYRVGCKDGLDAAIGHAYRKARDACFALGIGVG